jgi:hypothetical protein
MSSNRLCSGGGWNSGCRFIRRINHTFPNPIFYTQVTILFVTQAEPSTTLLTILTLRVNGTALNWTNTFTKCRRWAKCILNISKSKVAFTLINVCITVLSNRSTIGITSTVITKWCWRHMFTRRSPIMFITFA